MKKLVMKAISQAKRFFRYMDAGLREASKADPCWIYAGPMTNYICVM